MTTDSDRTRVGSPPAEPPIAEGMEQSGDSFLAEASRLLADTLDYDATLATVARLALPHLGAWCMVDVVEEDGEIRRVAVVHPEAGRQALARELQDCWPPRREDPVGVPVVARTRRSEVMPTMGERMLREMARDRHTLSVLRHLGIGSLMTVPLIARGDVLGAITFVGPEDGHHYTGDDLALAEDLAARAAIAIDNARLFRAAETAREAAEAGSRAKSQFLGVMSHELRTPINAILGYAQLLDMGVKGPLTDEQRELLGRMEASSKHLLELVTRILDVARAETGELTVQNHVAVAREVIQSALEEVRPRLSGDLQIEGGQDTDAAIRFLGDPIRARQILVHLLENAVRFTRAGGRIALSCTQVDGAGAPDRLRGTGPWIRMDVEDTGVGIPGGKLEEVFEPFVQGHSNSFTRETDGSGLGLAISRYLARLMGGDLTVDSTEGVGSRFSLWLPAPRPLGEMRRDRRLFEREADGLPFLARHLLRRLAPIMDTYVDRLRRDGAIPRAREASEVALRNHVPHFLSGIASLLSHAGHRGDEVTDVLRGGNTIQRLTLELHGGQRRRMGWSEHAVKRDIQLLRETVETDIRRSAPEEHDLKEAFEVLERLFDQAKRISLQGWRYTDMEEGDHDHRAKSPRDDLAWLQSSPG